MRTRRRLRRGLTVVAAAVASSAGIVRGGFSFDLRVAGGAKSVPATAGTYQLELWAQVSGSDGNHANEEFQSGFPVIQSSDIAGLSGGISGGLCTAPFDQTLSRNGAAADLNADGFTDWGTTATLTSDTRYMFVRAASAVAAGSTVGQALDTNGWEFKVATFNLTLNNSGGSGKVAVVQPVATKASSITFATYASYRQDGISATITPTNVAGVYGSYVSIGTGGAPTQQNATWDGGPAGAGNEWTDNTNWSGDLRASSVATFSNLGSATNIGINYDGATTGGTRLEALGKVVLASNANRSINLVRSSSTGFGTLSLTGVGGVAIDNQSPNQGIYFDNIGAGGIQQQLVLGGAINVQQAGGTVGISMALSGNVDKTGAGTLILSGASLPLAGVNTSVRVRAGTLINTSASQFTSNPIIAWTIDPGATATMDGFIGAVANFTVDGTLNIPSSKNLNLVGGASTGVIDVNSTSSTLTVGGSNQSYTFAGQLGGVGSLTKSGNGTQTLKHVRTAGLTISAGSLAISPNGGNGSVSYLKSAPIITASSNTYLDLNDNDLIVEYGTSASPFTGVQQKVIDGLGSDAGTIISSTGRTAANTIHYLIDNGLGVGLAEWPLGSGRSIDGNSVIAKYTYFGDCNLDGVVNDGDYGIIDANYNTSPVAGLAVISGDANLDGIVNDADYGIVDANYLAGAGNPLSPASQAVPEPGVGALLVAGLLGYRSNSRVVRIRRFAPAPNEL